MSDFNTAAYLVLSQEGGLVNNPDDPGSVTKYGISHRSYPDLDIPNLTTSQALSIYQSDYWQPEWSELSQPLADLLLSLSINMGKVGCIKLVQKAVGVPQDGVWGHWTQSTVLATPSVVAEIATAAIMFYISLDKPEFLRGWVSRILEATCN